MEAVLELPAMAVLALEAKLPESTLPASKAQGLEAGPTGLKPHLVGLASHAKDGKKTVVKVGQAV